MKRKVEIILAVSGLVMYVTLILFGFIYVVSDIAGENFNLFAVIFAISLFWSVIGLSEITPKIIQKVKNPRKQ